MFEKKTHREMLVHVMGILFICLLFFCFFGTNGLLLTMASYGITIILLFTTKIIVDWIHRGKS